MSKVRVYGAVFSIALVVCVVLSNPGQALAQNSAPSVTAAPSSARGQEVNYDVQLHLLVASNENTEKGTLPQSDEAIVRQLRSSLSFTNYRLASTFLNRVKDGGSLEVKGIGSFATASVSATSPTFYEYTLLQVKLDTDDASQPMIQIPKFRFGLRLPIQISSTRADGSNIATPVINYEPVGITTEMSIREGSPTVVGTMTTNRPDELFILVVSLKRTTSR